MIQKAKFLLTIALLASALPVHAMFASGDELKIKIIQGKKLHHAGDTVVLALQCSIADKYHLYGNPLGPGIGKPLKLSVSSGAGIDWLEARKSPAIKFKPDIGGWVWAYEKKATFFLIGKLKSDDKKKIQGTIMLEALVCHTACIPIIKKIEYTIHTGRERTAYPFANNIVLREAYTSARPMQFQTKTPSQLSGGDENAVLGFDLAGLGNAPRWDYEPVEQGMLADTKEKGLSAGSLAVAILLAFLAGLVLNAMPCVLPVLGVKILSFSQSAHAGRKEAVLRSIVFGAGMIAIFLVLASLAAFAGYSWGQQFQNPVMLAGIITIIFIFALGMFDVYTIIVPSRLATLESKAGHSLTGEFVRGMFATILATPCSGPFLGATLAWTLTQQPVVIYTVFTFIGIGMAFPYVLLSASSRIARMIPKPGKWMDDFKHVMGFLLFGFAVYLMKGLSSQITLGTMGLCVTAALGIASYKRFAPFGSSVLKRIVTGAICLAVIVAGGYISFEKFAKTDTSTNWSTFSPHLLEEAHMTGRHALANFTASWCMNCQYNKLRVLNSKGIKQLVDKKNILLLEVDLTNKNPDGESLLHHLGSRSVPFLAVFRGDDPYRPLILRDILRKQQLINTLKKLPEKTDLE